MKVVLINGSPREHGNTSQILDVIANVLNRNNIETKTFWITTKAIHGCIACNRCAETHRCIFKDDICNAVIDEMETADGLIIGSPVYYASANGGLDALLDRIFYAGNCFAHKPGAAVAVARRAGTTATIDQLNKYFTINEMPVVSSSYWNVAHGRLEGEVTQDEEGLYTMEKLAENMTWLLNCIEAGKKEGILPKEPVKSRVMTNFVR